MCDVSVHEPEVNVNDFKNAVFVVQCEDLSSFLEAKNVDFGRGV